MSRTVLQLFITIAFAYSLPYSPWSPEYLSKGWNPTANIFPQAPKRNNQQYWGNQQSGPGQGTFNQPFFDQGGQSNWLSKWMQPGKYPGLNTSTGENVQSVLSRVQNIVKNAEEMIHCIQINNTSPECQKRQEEEQRRQFPFGPPPPQQQPPESPESPGAQQQPPGSSVSAEPKQGQAEITPSPETTQQSQPESSEPPGAEQQPPGPSESPGSDQQQSGPNPSPEAQQPHAELPETIQTTVPASNQGTTSADSAAS
uniref:SXP/RAL-2 family protein Ani s 5-like cation-binding domain-containing protein n=1 Tax=Ascaris lumbricoides TaxID=6252 RepID=A0A9J2PGY5_ASCLU